MKVAIVGGHFAPALAVIEKLKAANVEIVVIGRKHAFEGDSGFSYEYESCKKLGIHFEELETGRLQRVLTPHSIASLLKFPKGISQALAILKSVKPDVIVSFGGYLAIPIALASSFLKIPVITHEQTQKAGLANKVIAPFVDTICISFPSSKKYFLQRKTILTGNPLRDEIFKIVKEFEVEKNKKILYITGGSGGSHFINEAILAILPQLLEEYIVIHQCGDSHIFNDYDKLLAYKAQLSSDLAKRYIVRKFIFNDEIGWIMKKASLVISRSGINTISELLALEKPALLIPLPHGQEDEQLENAQLIEKVGLGQYILQKDASSEVLLSTISDMMKNLKKFALQNSDINFKNASQAIVDRIQLVYEKKKERK